MTKLELLLTLRVLEVNNLVNFMHSQRGRKTRTAKRGFDLVEVTSIEIPDKEIVEFSIWDFQYLALTM